MTVGIVGLGLIGGSFAKAYHEAGATVLAWNRSRSVLDFAMMSGAVDGELTEDNVAACDLVLIALYPEATIAWFRRMAPHIGPHPVVLDCGGTHITLLDTPGHVDFSAEMERTLSVLDYAVLVISGSDGVQSHTRTLWRLLTRYEVPTFLFINKMDLAGADKDALLRQLTATLSAECVARRSARSLRRGGARAAFGAWKNRRRSDC